MKIYGPYMDGKKLRRIVILIYPDGSRKTTAHARYLLEQHLSRELVGDEEADHIDGDPLNDDLSNLQVLTHDENQEKSKRDAERVVFICPVCGEEATKLARHVRGNRKKGKEGPYCGRSCAGKASHQ